MSLRANILIATPTGDEKLTSSYTVSLLRLYRTFAAQCPGVDFTVDISSGSDLPFLRNLFASRFLNDPSYTHLLFIDSDMGFSPNLIYKYLTLDKPFVGALCPSREYKFEGAKAALQHAADLDEFTALAVNYICAESLVSERAIGEGGVLDGTPDGAGPKLRIENGVVRATRIGTGITMVTREVLDTIGRQHPDLLLKDGAKRYRDRGVDGPVIQCFTALANDDGEMFSEDISFCERWRRAGGEIWVCVDEPITHVGGQNYRGRYLDRMRKGLFQR